MVGVQFEFPFGSAHPTARWGRAMPSPYRPVERNYNVIVSQHFSDVKDVVAINPRTGLPYEVQHVASTGGAGGNGSATDAWLTVAQAQAAGADIIYVHSNTVLNEQITLGNGQQLLGEMAGHDGQVGHAGLPKLRDKQFEHGRVAERHERLGKVLGKRPEAGSFASREQHRLHGDSQPLNDEFGLHSAATQLAQITYRAVAGSRCSASQRTVCSRPSRSETSGFQPTPAAERLDFAAMALGAGYEAAYEIDDLGVLRERLPSILNERGPVLVALKVELETSRKEVPQDRPKDQAGALRAQLVG